MPRRPMLARIKYGNAIIDIYDLKALELLLEKLEREGSSKEGNMVTRKQYYSIKTVTREEAQKETKFPQPSKPLSDLEGLPSFARDNPWLEVLSKSK